MTWQRRKFIRTTSVLASVGSCGLTSLVGCTPVQYISGEVKDDQLIIDKGQWGESAFVLVKHQQLSAPIFVKRLPTGYTALYLECTHKKCEVRANSKTLKCPCHGSEFDHRGQVLNGPAENELKSFQIREDEKYIYIQ